MSSAPPLIRHRDEYFRSTDTKRAVARAAQKYPLPDVVVAITNYATVLGGDEYFWGHSWTMCDFLKRGLDKFVDEAHPLENFRVRANGRNGHDNGLGAVQIYAQALELERQGR